MQVLQNQQPLLRVVYLTGLLCLGFTVAGFFPLLFAALIVSLLLAFVLQPSVRFLEIHMGIQRRLSVGIILIGLSLVLFLAAAKGIPLLLDSVKELYAGFRNFPFDQKLDELVLDVSRLLPVVDAASVSRNIRTALASGLHTFTQDAGDAAASSVSFLIVPIVTYYALAQGESGLKHLLEHVPNKYFEMTLNVVDKIKKDLVGYLRGWLLDSFIVGILNMVGFALLGVQHPILMGVLAGISNLIPYVGPFVGVIPVFLVSMSQTGDLSMIPSIAILTLIIQAVDNVIVQPVCFAKTVDMHPLTVIVVLVVGSELLGVFGMLIAIPLYTILKVTARESYWGLQHYRITA